jgi:hypothetical protein
MNTGQDNGPLSGQLQQELESHIARLTGRRVLHLRVEVQPEGIVLRGQTHSYYVKQLAQHGVRDLLPEVHLDNAISVDGAPKPTASGEFLRGAVSEPGGR